MNDVLIIDNWTLHGDDGHASSPVTGSEIHDTYEFCERGGGETTRLRWAYTGQSTQIIPQAYLFPATARPTMTYISGSASAIIDDAITVADVDSATISSGRLSSAITIKAARIRSCLPIRTALRVRTAQVLSPCWERRRWPTIRQRCVLSRYRQ